MRPFCDIPVCPDPVRKPAMGCCGAARPDVGWKLPQGAGRADVVKAIKGAGLWPMLKQRPLGKMPSGDAAPAAIFVNGMDTAPLAGDPCFSEPGAVRSSYEDS